MDLDRDLNPEQKAAVLHGDGPLLILAGAGSGKTRAITYRIAHLIGKRDVAPHRILAVTFTNKAAGEMRERVEGLSGRNAGVWISTFHSLGARILRRHADLIGRSRDFVIYDEDDSRRLGIDVLRELRLDPERRRAERLLRKIESAKHRLKGPGQSDLPDRLERNFYARYQDRLQATNAFDFADLIFQTHRLFAEQPEVLRDYRERFRYVLVDEFQDTDRAQYGLLRLVCKADANLCVVGDDDQSIYMWRDADVGHILGFKRDYPTAKVIRLERNYRSTPEILEAASKVISANSRRHVKKLWTEGESGAPVDVKLLDNEHAEAEQVARRIYTADADGQNLNRVAVFYRVNAQSRAMEDALRLYGIPYRIVGGTRFFDRREIRDLVAYLRLVQNPLSDVDAWRIINVPARGIGKLTRERLQDFATRKNLTLLDAIGSGPMDFLRKSKREKVLGFKNLISELRDEARDLPASEIIGLVIERSAYLETLEHEDALTALGRRENIEELVGAARDFSDMSGDGSLVSFLDHVALVTAVDLADAGSEAISLMTLHAAKGLEFDMVFMVGLEEGLLPHYRVLRPEEEEDQVSGGVEEERRLCYVGMTRARKMLQMSCVQSRTIFGRSEENPPSRFLDQLVEQSTSRQREKTMTDHAEICLDDGDGIVVDYDAQYDQSAVDNGRPRQILDEWIGLGVQHSIFGRGLVRDVGHSRLGLKLLIDFEDVGPKTVLARYVKPV